MHMLMLTPPPPPPPPPRPGLHPPGTLSHLQLTRETCLCPGSGAGGEDPDDGLVATLCHGIRSCWPHQPTPPAPLGNAVTLQLTWEPVPVQGVGLVGRIRMSAWSSRFVWDLMLGHAAHPPFPPGERCHIAADMGACVCPGVGLVGRIGTSGWSSCVRSC